MANEKTWYILWFCRTSGTVSPSLFEPYNLNHVSFSPVTIVIHITYIVKVL